MMEGMEKFEITLEKYDATKRIQNEFEKKFNVLDMVFNKVEAFKLAATNYTRQQTDIEPIEKSKKSKVPLIDYKQA